MLYIGSREPYGSWKIGCTRRRNAKISLLFSAEVSTPSKMILPDVGSSRSSTICATVDLPDPDSPTIAVVVPRLTLKETSSTAVKSVDLPNPARSLKTLLRFWICSTSSVTPVPPQRPRWRASTSSVETPSCLATWMRRDASDGAEATSRCV